MARPPTAPDLPLTTLSGQKIRLGQLRGHVVLLNFWSTDCPSCLRERPLLADLHRRYASRGLAVIAVAMPYDPPNRLVRFVKTHPAPYETALDPAGAVSRAFQVTLVPTTLLIAADGVVTWRHTGIPDAGRLRSMIETLLSRGE